MLNYCLSQALISVHNARDLRLTTSREPLFWYPGPRALPYTSWVKLGEGPCASNKGPPKKGGKGRPWESAFPILLRQKWSDQSRRWSILSATYSSDILDEAESAMATFWQPNRCIGHRKRSNCRSYLGTPLHPSTLKFAYTFGLAVFLFVAIFCTAIKRKVLRKSYNVENWSKWSYFEENISLNLPYLD
jgi:hypothetical protein